MEGAQSSLQSQRVLAAIVVTDAVGFSAQMSANEERALATINRDLKQIGDLCTVFEGQVLKSTGDGLLMYFFSAAQAVSCALQIQKKMRGDGIREGFVHRIGIHLGDVYINESDVMGNGVNIAARLEGFSAPGEICVSQVVYDVVKSRLELDATFLGPLNLKNIQEPVPAYQIRPEPEPDICESELTRPFTQSSAADTPIEKALVKLGEYDNPQRIKKLLFGTCQNLWENDATILDQFSLQYLIESLVQRNPSMEQCRASLYRIVATLNHKEAYAEVAEAILVAIAPIHSQQTIDPFPTHPNIELGDISDALEKEVRDSYQQVAEELNHHPQSIRIKKVLYCLCHKVWETDIQKVEQADTVVLVKQLYQLAPTPHDLKYRLRHLLQRLNRKAQYTKIVRAIFKAFNPLYIIQAELALMSTPEGLNSSDSDNPETCLNYGPMGDGHPENTIAFSSQVLEAPLPNDSNKVKDRADLFELRLDIIKYCNPLRAKILLYSTLYSPFTGSAQEWAALRRKTLEDFLREAFDYCPSFQDLDSKLTIMSHCLPDSVDNEPVVRSILNAIRPYYPQPQPLTPAAHPRTEPTEPTTTTAAPARTAPAPPVKHASYG